MKFLILNYPLIDATVFIPYASVIHPMEREKEKYSHNFSKKKRNQKRTT